MPEENSGEIYNEATRVELIEQNSEFPAINYDVYTEICNHSNDGSRKRGVLSEEMYQDIVGDPGTCFINSGEFRIPVLMDEKYGLAMGYDAEKCKEYASELSPNIKILMVPFHELNDDEKNQVIEDIKSRGDCALYFSDHLGDESKALSEALEEANLTHSEKPLTDPRVKDDNKEAALYLYSCRTEQSLERGERRKLSLRDVKEFYDKNIGPKYTSDGKVVTVLNMGDELDEQHAEEMWNVYNNRFDFLGENHPISMQDSKGDFFKLLKSNNTLISATYEKGDLGDKLVCFTYFIDNLSELYWLNQKYLNDNFYSYSEDHDYVTNVFTPGLVSSGVARSYSFLPIGFFTKASDEAGLSTSVMYENTNLSKDYVPRIVDSAIRRSCNYMTLEPSRLVDCVKYKLWSIGNEAV